MLVCVGGINNATVTATTTGGTFSAKSATGGLQTVVGSGVANGSPAPGLRVLDGGTVRVELAPAPGSANFRARFLDKGGKAVAYLGQYGGAGRGLVGVAGPGSDGLQALLAVGTNGRGVTAISNSAGTEVATLTEGDAFGEFSLLTGAPTTAAVHMPEGGVLLHLSAEAFARLRPQLGSMESELAELMEVRRGELDDLIGTGEGASDFELVDEAWLVGE
ncbi:MAG: hypothetical protein WCO25_06230 [Candidatus Uhrbacteria bacterium]